MLIVERRCNVGNLEGQNLSRVGLTISDACSNQQAYISGSYPKSWAKAHEPSDLTSPAAAPTRDQGLLSLLPSSFHTSFSHWRTVPGSLLAWEYGNGVYRLCAPVSSGGELRRWAQEVSSEGKWVLGVNKSYPAVIGSLNLKIFPLAYGALLSLMQTFLVFFYCVDGPDC